MMSALAGAARGDVDFFERLMGQCFDAMPGMILMLDKDGGTVFCNRAAHRYFGPRVTLSRGPEERDALFHPDDRAAGHAALRRALREGISLTVPLRAMRYDYTMHWHDFEVTPLFDQLARTAALLVRTAPIVPVEERVVRGFN
jgi:PAS domain-containing protein